jgi:hypothetical protein
MEPVTKNPPVEKKPKLLDEVRNTLRTKHYSMETEEAYIHGIKKYIFFTINVTPKRWVIRRSMNF